MKTILFVCTGNTCRSPMAAAIFNKLAKENGIKDIKAESAGIGADDGAFASENAIEAVKEIGCDIRKHRSRQLTPQMMKKAEHVYTMSKSRAELLKHYFENEKDKISPLGEIPDPFGTDLESYRNCRDCLLALIKNLKEQVK